MNHLPRARKRFGQNFLRDPGIIRKIVRSIAPRPGDALVEIGPGTGALTEELLATGVPLTAVELDRDLISGLRVQFFNQPLTLVEGDALRTDFRSLLPEGSSRLRVVGNLPYNISTPLLFHLLEQREIIGDMHFMLQWEVVERLAASPGCSDYGRLSVMTQYHCRVEPLFQVPPESFVPRPKVMSGVVRLTPHDALPYPARDTRVLNAVVREAFGQRRKTLRNALRERVDDATFERLGIDPTRRPETLSVQEFVMLADAVTP